ncbi:hypothetical protein HN615_11430 [Candidatus Woesearchaeota archaeon]|nr:hypothetical protein [Candidatus Woesearchaeota archaeon]
MINSSENRYYDFICNNWTDIENSVIGGITTKEINFFVRSIYQAPIKDIKKIEGRGNSRLYKVTTSVSDSFVLKEYPDLLIDSRKRLITEVEAFKAVEIFNKTPKVVAFDEQKNIALYEWIEGVHLSKINDKHIIEALNFIEDIQSIKHKERYKFASEACLSAEQLFSQINSRLDKVSSVDNNDLKDFVNLIFKPLWSKVLVWSKKHWPEDNLVNDLPEFVQALSPSDFGFHNALLMDDGTLCFLDFEYFGRDDPVKLMADFVWHPGMDLDISQKVRWLKGALNIFKKDPNIYSRFHAAWPLYGLRWSLILLNEFLEDGWHKRLYANSDLKHQHSNKLEEQLNKARAICEQIQMANMECPYI